MCDANGFYSMCLSLCVSLSFSLLQFTKRIHMKFDRCGQPQKSCNNASHDSCQTKIKSNQINSKQNQAITQSVPKHVNEIIIIITLSCIDMCVASWWIWLKSPMRHHYYYYYIRFSCVCVLRLRRMSTSEHVLA